MVVTDSLRWMGQGAQEPVVMRLGNYIIAAEGSDLDLQVFHVPGRIENSERAAGTPGTVTPTC